MSSWLFPFVFPLLTVAEERVGFARLFFAGSLRRPFFGVRGRLADI
jgi:hypothetical protein